jgi:HAD superfamily phosphatase (TIGR01668 family)
MKLLRPDFYFKMITDIPLSFLKNFQSVNNGVRLRCVLVDVDETIAPRDCPELLAGAREWLVGLIESNIKIILVSNNREARVKVVADALGVPFVCSSLKPTPFGIKKALKIMKCNKKESILIGDQIFTDILGANLCGIRSILVDPLNDKSGTLFSGIKRIAESPLRKNLSKLRMEQVVKL